MGSIFEKGIMLNQYLTRDLEFCSPYVIGQRIAMLKRRRVEGTILNLLDYVPCLPTCQILSAP